MIIKNSLNIRTSYFKSFSLLETLDDNRDSKNDIIPYSILKKVQT